MSNFSLNVEQGTISVQEVLNWAEAFLVDRQSEGCSPGTLYFYRMKLQLFLRFCAVRGVTEMQQITPTFIREYLLNLESTGHNPGGIHACYRALKTFLYWHAFENDLNTQLTPIKKVKVRVPKDPPLDPVDIVAVKAILGTCRSSFADLRDRAIILMLLDTGLRISELLALEHENVNPITGVIQVLHGKGGKFRVVFIGRKTRNALRKYTAKTPGTGRLFIQDEGDPATYWTVRDMFKRRSAIAGVKHPTPHQFRRTFTVTMLRAGINIYSLQLLTGHADVQVLRRYVKLTQMDGLEAHLKGSPVDRLIK